ncbi:P63C domain-containing protein [Pyxidicoccus sp. 3LFB2]
MAQCNPNTQTQVFHFEKQQVRVFTDAMDDPWFVAIDVCNALRIANCQEAVSQLGDHERNTVVMTDGNRGPANLTIVSESGMYTLVSTNPKKEAVDFRRWVRKTVLTSIRKAGLTTVPMKARRVVAEHFMRAGLAPWVKRFPDEFYREIFRLHQWPWDGPATPRPGVMAHYTNDVVYERLAPGLLRRLCDKNPLDENGNRRVRHHQLLSDDIGHPTLEQHLRAVIDLMKRCHSWWQFMHLLDCQHPRPGDNLMLPFIDDLLLPPTSTR